MKRTSLYSRLAGRVIIRGFAETSLSAELRRVLETGELGGLIVFRRNVESLDQLAELISEAKSLVPKVQPISFGVDQEGGRVVRIGAPLTVLPPARTIGGVSDPVLTEDLGLLVGKELCALGFTMNFAPVLDVDTRPDSPVIGDRAYGDEPKTVTVHGLAFGRGLLNGGVVPCAKHFPGHGDAALDSHHHLPRVAHDKDRLENIELKPFRAWCRADLGPIMTAHVVYPALDPQEPATCSRPIVETLLRQEIGFRGALLSDDLEMGAVAEFGGAERVALEAIRSGVDGLLICRSFELQEQVRDALIREAMEDEGFGHRLEGAASRLANLVPSAPAKVDCRFLGSPEHDRLKSEIGRRIAGLDRLTS